MKIALIGATGFVGRVILKEALDRGHQVTAIVRHAEKLKSENNLSIVSCDVMDHDSLAEAIKGNDIVVSAYNAGWTNPNLYREFLKGAKSIQQAVRQGGINRLLVIGGAGSLYVTPHMQLVDTPAFPAAWKPGAEAARDYLNILKKEDQLTWTFLSPAIEMNQGAPRNRTGIYRIGLDEPVLDKNGKSRISVDDLAVAVLDEVEHPRHQRQRFTVGY